MKIGFVDTRDELLRVYEALVSTNTRFNKLVIGSCKMTTLQYYYARENDRVSVNTIY
jgi:hypothetical protein